MILRAIFWIGLVSFLMPREPDLGFGRPQAPSVPSVDTMAALIQSSSAQDACAAHRDACAGTLSLLDNVQAVAVRSLDQVRADIEANRAKAH